jgi:NADH-quinone oxidoreductase subunit L
MFVAMGVGAYAAGAFHLMTHAFFKALLFLGSGAVIHAMAGEQDMVKMGALKKYLPVTYATMMIGTLAIAGIPPFSGFFSKDEILWRAFQKNQFVWALAVLAALMTAFYMFRLMSLTFFGAYRGRAFATAGHQGAVAEAAIHGAAHPADPFAHGQAQKAAHEVSHGPADAVVVNAGHDDAHGGHGAGGWHGPHEAPKPMTFALVTLAVGAVLAGFVGIPGALGGGNQIETFLHPSFTAHASVAAHADVASGASRTSEVHEGAPAAAPAGAEAAAEHESRGLELGLMLFSVLVGATGIFVAWRFYVRSPEIAEHLAQRFAGAHKVLYNKYYVDEFYGATVIDGTMGSANGLWTFDRTVVDGAVNGSGWLTIFSSYLSHLVDKYIVDGLVNLVGSVLQESSFIFRRFQTGLIQNYALLMLFGVFACVSIYLLW